MARRSFAVGALVAVVAAWLPMSAQLAGASSAVSCVQHQVPVSLGGLSNQFVSAELCAPPVAAPTVVVLVSGATYGKTYWDFPFQPDNYSMVRYLNEAGYATLNYDRPGVGSSSHPPSTYLTVDSQASVLHQLVQRLRLGGFDTTVGPVFTVGHSLGSATVITEAATYGDVDGVVPTGFGHRVNAPGLLGAAGSLYPALLDPRFADKGLDPGYLTTLPGRREAAFSYNTANADPAVIALDEATKETATPGELVGSGTLLVVGQVAPAVAPLCQQLGMCNTPVLSPLVQGPSGNIHVPVLIQVGGTDAIVCGTLGTNCASSQTVAAAEALFWPPDACLRAAVVPNAGHDLTLHRNAHVGYQQIVSWIADVLADGCIGGVK